MIAENAGTDGSIVVGKLSQQNDANFGYNAQSGEYNDMIKSGIIDPVKVVRTALQDAASIADLMTTTEATVTGKPEKKGGGGGMGDMDF